MSDAFIFRLHNSNDTSIKGWGKSNHISGNLIATIPDTLLGQAALRKMGTSIPSPFARMYLFDTAFTMIQNQDQNGISPYHLLVSECLDLLEFLYLRANDSRLEIKKWDKVDELNHLRQSPLEEHKRFADVLESHLAMSFPDLREIYLFFYDNTLIGGTSPLTIVFTSPNWQRKKTQNFSGGIAGQQLFSGGAYPLHRRSKDFREYMQKLRLAYNIQLSQQAEHFYNYLQNSYNGYDTAIRSRFITEGLPKTYAAANLLNEYERVQIPNSSIVTAGVLPLMHKKRQIDPAHFHSGYMIRPTCRQFEDYMWDGVPVHLPTPLALTDQGLPNVAYLGGQPWDTHTCQLQRLGYQSLHERELPGGSGLRYPYLMDTDFLQDTIIKVPYVIDSNLFETCYDGESKYLLPLKKDYFKFFTLQDLKQNMTIKSDNGTVTVSLRIPIVDATNPYITFEKKYSGANIVECIADSSDKYFNIGCTPFYKVVDNIGLNNYCVLLGDTSGKTSIDFYTFDSLDTEVIPTPPMKRSDITQYIHLKGFDIIQVNYDGNKALVIPQMKEVKIANANTDYLFCVDFGTTNTHISYSTNNGATSIPFDIQKEDMQVAFLNKLDLSGGNSGFSYWKSFYSSQLAQNVEREFVPALLGGNQASVSYPYRTAVCETANFTNNPTINLFGNISLGFFMMRELFTEDKKYKYHTDLKWALESGNGNINVCENRVQAYCLQIIWMIKNKVLLNGGNPGFKLVLTFPGTMSVITKNKYLTFWKNACTDLLPGITVKLIEESESVVPYYSFVKNAINTVSDAVNVDIGGGTTDMLFIQRSCDTPKQYYTSCLFAANDLWGDGLANIPKKDNGNIKLVDDALKENRITISQPNLLKYYNTYKETAQTSADIVSFLFKNDKEFRLSSLIKNNNKLYSLVFIYFAAVMYHITQVTKKIGMGIPTYLTFTGMGSNLIKLISPNEDDIKEFAKLLLETFSREEAPALFKVIFAENPKEITAEGGLASQHPNIGRITPTLIKIYGFETAKERYEFQDTLNLKPEVLNEFFHFLDVFTTTGKIKDWLFNQYQIRISQDTIAELKKYADKSFDLMAKRKLDSQMVVNETLFFWPLKQALYELTK